jgi:transketolase
MPGSDVRDRREALARRLRRDAIRATAAAGSGHPTSSLSAADLMAVLLDGYLRYDVRRPHALGRDHFVLSKGHASPLLYAALRAMDAIDDDELLTFRKLSSRLEGHPTPRLPWVDVATGSLGQGLPIAVGMALAARLQGQPSRMWVLAGDSEMAEGSVWEAVQQAAFYELGSITLIVDVNRLGQRGPTMLGWDLDAYARRIEGFGWGVACVDGHDLDAIARAYDVAAADGDRPTAVLARTLKGRGVPAIEDDPGMHGKPLEDAELAITGLGDVQEVAPQMAKVPEAELRIDRPRAARRPGYRVGKKVATRLAFGEALAALGDVRPDVTALDGEVSNSTYSGKFAERHPDRFFEHYIAEQQLVASAVGMAARGLRPVASTFAAFLSRASDFVRMAAISRVSMALVGTHAGVSIGEDGPSQMALEDLAAFRALTGSTVLYPCDANQCAALTWLLPEIDGIAYLRATRGDTPVIYAPDEEFGIGGSRVVRTVGSRDEVTIVAAGITVHEALRAADRLHDGGPACRVIDAYSVKPLDVDTILGSVDATDGRLVIAEDHRPEGGLGEAVLAALAPHSGPLLVEHLAVRELPGSGRPDELLHQAGIDHVAIAEAAQRLAAEPAPRFATAGTGTSAR